MAKLLPGLDIYMTCIFVSYSRRDGVLTIPMLESLERYLSGLGSPFVHALDTSRPRWPQMYVIYRLIRSSAIVLVLTPRVFQSPWVRLGLLIGKMLFLPVIYVKASQLPNKSLQVTFDPPPTFAVAKVRVASNAPELRR